MSKVTFYDEVKGKGAHEPKAQMAAAYCGFLSMPRSIAAPPGWEASPHRITPQQYVAGTLLYTWVKRDKVE